MASPFIASYWRRSSKNSVLHELPRPRRLTSSNSPPPCAWLNKTSTRSACEDPIRVDPYRLVRQVKEFSSQAPKPPVKPAGSRGRREAPASPELLHLPDEPAGVQEFAGQPQAALALWPQP